MIKKAAILSTSKKQNFLDRLRFRHVCKIDPDPNRNGNVRAFCPQPHYKKCKVSKLHPYGSGCFCKFKIPTTISESGVFAITLDEQVKYIGECKELTKRFNSGFGNISPANCYQGGQQTDCRVNKEIYKTVKSGYVIDLWFWQIDNHKSEKKRLLNLIKPEWNLG